MSSRLQDPDASRSLQSASPSRINHLSNGDIKFTSLTVGGDGKSRGESLAMEDLLRPSITIKPYPPKITVKPRTLQPLMLVPREHIRLSFLDFASPFGSFESSQSFESNIRILDLESRMGTRPVVLIARLESNKSAYVIERQANSLYTLCHLGPWVDLEQLSDFASVSLTDLIRKNAALPTGPIAPASLTTPQISHANNKRRLAIEAIQSLVKKPARSRSISVHSHNEDASKAPTPIQGSNGPDVSDTGNGGITKEVPPPGASDPVRGGSSQGGVVDVEEEALNTPSAEGIFNNIRNQYLEALYHSMGSLAYFAKGPLSRARAAFHLDYDSTLEMNDLIEFLKSLVMNTVQIDKKYRETIPKIQAEMKTTFEDSDAEQGQGKGKPRKRKIKKMKIGQDGLYPDEDEHIRRWWTAHMPRAEDREESTTKSNEQQDTRLQISLLRSRETQLQMIIILEILALEPLLQREANANESQLPGLPLSEETQETPKEPPAKKRNKHNLPFLLDVHADRLCIWQSTALDELNVANESQSDTRPGSRKSLASTTDPLKDFCVDIIVPFFSARLPAQCDSINRKLGGPIMVSPPKSVPKRPEPASKPKPKPGTATKRPAPSKISRALEKSLSKETERHRRSMSRGPSGAIALMRSATTPTIPLLKREASEPLSLNNIPRADSPASQQKQTPSVATVPSKRRWAETKEKRDAFVKAELRDAISTLRKPNREVVGKAMAEADERRALRSLSQLRKSRKPTQHPQFQSIVKATPVGTRFRDVLARSTTSQPEFLRRSSMIEEEPVFSSSMVPSSAPRKRNLEAAFGGEQTHQKRDASTIEQVIATPAKTTRSDSLLLIPQPDEGVVLASSPVMSRKISQPSFAPRSRPATLGHRDSGIDLLSSPGKVDVLVATPIKPRANSLMTPMDTYVTLTPAKLQDKEQVLPTSVPDARDAGYSNQNNNLGKKLTIFERLGWDDDIDDLA